MNFGAESIHQNLKRFVIIKLIFYVNCQNYYTYDILKSVDFLCHINENLKYLEKSDIKMN